MTPNTLRSNLSWNTIANIGYAGFQWGILIVIARMSSTYVVGQFALALAITAPIFMFADMQLRSVFATDALDSYQFSDYLNLRMISVIIALLLVLVIVQLFISDSSTRLIIVLIGFSKLIEGFGDIFHGVFQRQEQMSFLGISKLSKGFFGLFGIIIGFKLSGGVILGLVFLIIGWLLVVLLYDIPRSRNLIITNQIKTRWNDYKDYIRRVSDGYFSDRLNSLKSLFLLALPLGISRLLITFRANIPRYAISTYHGESQLGVFAALAYLIVAGSTVIDAIGITILPSLSKYHISHKRSEYVMLLFKSSIFVLVLCFVGLVVTRKYGGEFLGLIYGEKYAAEYETLNWLMLGATISFLASILGYGILAARKFLDQLILQITTVASVIVASFVLIPEYVNIGAAKALFIAAITQFLLSLLFVIIILVKKQVT